MAAPGLYADLQKLHDLILRERECAKSLAVDELMAITEEKETLLQRLKPVESAGPEMRALAEKIQRENRRNAYLFWSTLKFIRESVNFFNRQVAQTTSYGAAGGVVHSGSSGMLLTGRV
jgi:flagellar biosynthesis/type III secretory pathway chaperone